MREVFGRDLNRVSARRQSRRYHQVADVRLRLRVPHHRHRHRPVYARGDPARVAVRPHGDGEISARTGNRLIEGRLNPRRAAIYHKALVFLIGPPLAVRKLQVVRWPMSFVLDDADAMIPGRTLSAVNRIQLEARISPSGEALPRAGDLVGRLENVDPRTTEPVTASKRKSPDSARS